MRWQVIIILIIALGNVPLTALASGIFPFTGMSHQKYWNEDNVWREGRASFRGQVIAPACIFSMEETDQVVDMGEVRVRDLQKTSSGPEKRFQLRLRDCDLAGTGKKGYTSNRVRVMFDGVAGARQDRFSTSGQAEGVELQIVDVQGYAARAGKVMPALLLEGNEQSLEYILRVVRNGEPLKSGDYFASLRFNIDYE
ncbi:type 1 fimbrial protein [Citrobacter freundii]|nr:type 1 fimbrial protein [Citrobacter freundii]MBC6509461.1 type 1 fimbrial protein [Citrobacter freundii]